MLLKIEVFLIFFNSNKSQLNAGSFQEACALAGLGYIVPKFWCKLMVKSLVEGRIYKRSGNELINFLLVCCGNMSVF